MDNKINTVLEEFDTLSVEEQEAVVEIEKKRLIERKRKLLVKNVKEAEDEFNSGQLKSETVDDIMKAIDDEADKDS
jgi:hypothetical protein